MQADVHSTESSNGQRMTENPVVVCGAGAAGIAAALAAARCGADVWLIESHRCVGGTVVHALIHTLAGFFDSRGDVINPGLPQEIVETLLRAHSSVVKRRMGRMWVLSAAPELYLDVVQQMLVQESRIRLHNQARVTKAERQDGRIVRIEGLLEGETFHVAPRAVIDATGNGALIRQINPDLMDEDPHAAAGGLIFRLRGVAADAMDFSKGLAAVRALHAAAAEGTLPHSCRHAWLDRGVTCTEVYVKLLVPPSAAPPAEGRSGDPALSAEHLQAIVVDFLRTMPGFNNARIDKTGRIGVRDGGRVRGQYQLTGADVRQGKRFDDAACRACWPIEYWDAEQGLKMEYLPANQSYDIPIRSLEVLGLRNAWVAGKCLSADREAQASARVVGCCWAMGAAAGKAAAGA